MVFSHVPVLYEEAMEYLNIRPDGIYADGTLGGAGHSQGICGRLDERGTLIGIDRDSEAISAAKERLRGFPCRCLFVHSNYSDIKKILRECGVGRIDGALLDLGVSSHQLDDAERGSSYRADAPLDMRMSQSGPTAADFVNTKSREEIAKTLREFGEEPYAWQIAGRIVARREEQPFTTTLQLADAVASALPPAVRRKDKNPSRRTFQAIRIAVNGELDALSEGLDEIFDLLAPGGRFCIITFHSLEDRVVKQRFRQWATACTCPPELPVCVCGGKAKAKLITRKPIEATGDELASNRRSRSAKLRVIEKL